MRAYAIALVGITAILGIFPLASADTESIKVGTLRAPSGGPLFVAQDKGYFAAQGLDAQFVFTDAPQMMGKPS